MIARLAASLTRWIVSKAGLIFLGLALGTSLAALWISEQSQRELREASQQLMHSQRTVSALQELHQLLLDTEAAERGYIITGREAELEPYAKTLEKVAPAVQSVREMMQDHPSQQKQLGVLEGLIKDALRESYVTIAMRNVEGFDIARRLVERGRGKEIMQSIRTLVTQIEQGEEQLLQTRIGALEDDLSKVRASIFIVVAFNASLIVIGLVFMWKEQRARRDEQRLLLTQQSLLERMVDERTAELYELSRNMEQVREREKAQLAREIHDELGSTILAAKIDVAGVRDKLQPVDEKLAQRLARALDALSNVIKVKRRIIEDLRPTLLDSLGVGAALQWQGKEFTARTNCRCEIVLYDNDLQLPEPLSIALYRIVQEALTNITKHAQATEVRIAIARDANEIVLRVADNGIGVDAGKKTNPTSHGLIGMRERARHLGGTIEIVGAAGKGTTITVRVPAPEPAA